MGDLRSFGAGVAGTFNQVTYGDDNSVGSAKQQVLRFECPVGVGVPLLVLPLLARPVTSFSFHFSPAPLSRLLPLTSAAKPRAGTSTNTRPNLAALTPLQPSCVTATNAIFTTASSHRLLPPPPIAQVPAKLPPYAANTAQ